MPNVQFVSHIATVKKATDEKLLKAAEVIGGMAESRAKQYLTEKVYQAPQGWYVRTGNLRNSITHETVTEPDAVTVVVGSSVEYAPYVELGTGRYAEGSGGRGVPWRYQDNNGNWHTTSGMQARPYLRPAIENHISQYRDVLEQVLKED